jgi:hypothetical protein
MDVAFFLKERIAFIRRLYEGASSTFVERMRKIENGEEPFVPPYSEDAEPAFQNEWIEADTSLQVLGHACISMLAAALHLYLETWAKELRLNCRASHGKVFKNKGWFHGYSVYFESCLGIQFDQTPANPSVLEEVVLARNRIAHPESILSAKANYAADDLGKLRRPLFLDERTSGLSDLPDLERFLLFPPMIHVTGEKLAFALAEVERFCTWLESQITSKLYGQRQGGDDSCPTSR